MVVNIGDESHGKIGSFRQGSVWKKMLETTKQKYLNPLKHHQKNMWMQRMNKSLLNNIMLVNLDHFSNFFGLWTFL